MQAIKKPPYIWLISGCSSGFGRELALKALSMGDFVGVSSRKVEDVEDICKQYPETSVAITLDVTKKQEINLAIKKIKRNMRAPSSRHTGANHGCSGEDEGAVFEEVGAEESWQSPAVGF